MIRLVHRPIDFARDREYVLERHCRVNYACDSPWARAMAYEEYRRNWFAMPEQINEFWEHLQESAKDPRAITEIIEDKNGETAAYLWCSFWENEQAGIACLEVQDVYVDAFRKQGVASRLFAYAERGPGPRARTFCAPGRGGKTRPPSPCTQSLGLRFTGMNLRSACSSAG